MRSQIRLLNLVDHVTFLDQKALVAAPSTASWPLEATLLDAGFQTHAVADGDSACEAIEFFAPRLIFVSGELPGDDAQRVLSYARTQDHEPASIALFADRAYNVDELVRLGADDCLFAPFRSEEVLLRAHQALTKRAKSLRAPHLQTS